MLYASLIEAAGVGHSVDYLKELAHQYTSTVKMLAAADPAVDSSRIRDNSVLNFTYSGLRSVLLAFHRQAARQLPTHRTHSSCNAQCKDHLVID